MWYSVYAKCSIPWISLFFLLQLIKGMITSRWYTEDGIKRRDNRKKNVVNKRYQFKWSTFVNYNYRIFPMMLWRSQRRLNGNFCDISESFQTKAQTLCRFVNTKNLNDNTGKGCLLVGLYCKLKELKSQTDFRFNSLQWNALSYHQTSKLLKKESNIN